MRRLLLLAALLVALPGGAVTIEWALIGDPDNPPDANGRGSVSYEFYVGKYEVTNAQYADFLNAVGLEDAGIDGVTDTGLYNTQMGSDPTFGGITRTGKLGSYTYAAKSGFENRPVAFVSFYDALRFANWLSNGRPVGEQDGTTTEDGAYTITLEGVASNNITRNEGAEAFLTSENEWYKAAYYNPALNGGLGGYNDYPAGADEQTTCAAPSAAPNAANCGDVLHALTDVGAYSSADSPYGTFDQGGNLVEWTEATILGAYRGARGGSWGSSVELLGAAERDYYGPSDENIGFGFRVARVVPEPAQVLLVLTGGLVLAAVHGRRA